MKKLKHLLRAIPIKTVLSLLLLISICATVYLTAGRKDATVTELGGYKTCTRAENGGIINGKMMYAEYRYEKTPLTRLERSEKFTVVDYLTLETLQNCLTDYEKRIEDYLENGNSKNREFALKYGFDPSALSEGDYCYLTVSETEDGESVTEYTVYYFDLSENKLYYFYSNTEFKLNSL